MCPSTKSDPLDVYRHRDDLARAYNPANAHERMLVTEIAQAWERLQFARETEQRYRQGRDMVEVITTRLAEFKAVTSFVTDCERAWKQAVHSLQTSQRQRQRVTPMNAVARPNASLRPTPPPVEDPPAAPYFTATAQTQRE